MILNKTKRKNRIYSLLVTAILITNTFAYTAFASSFSTSYSLNDESLSYSNSSDTLESASYSMDMSNIYWTDRTAESNSYTMIDSNSQTDIQSEVTPPAPTPGDSSAVAGGRPDREDLTESDNATLIALGEYTKEEINEDLNLHTSPHEPFKALFEELYRRETGGCYEDLIDQTEPKLVANVVYPQVEVRGEDVDGCSFSFENRFLGSNPYMSDTDKDGIEDCDEALIYGSNPTSYDTIENYLGLSNIDGLVYTESAPLFVGHAKNSLSQIEITKTDPFISFGLFFLDVQEDDNFAEISKVELEDGLYEAKIFHEDMSQDEAEILTIDTSFEYEPLELLLPESGQPEVENNIIQIDGTTGAYYGVVAVWKHENFVDVSAVVSDWNGNFEIYSPLSFEDGEYQVSLYALKKQGDMLVQTNYQDFNFKLENGNGYILKETKKINNVNAHQASNYFNADIASIEKIQLDTSPENTNYMYLLSFTIFLVFSLATFFTLCRRK